MNEACLRDMEELREVEREQQNLIRLQKDKLKRLEQEIKGLKEDNRRKEETLNSCRIDLLQLEKEKGLLSAVSYENKALKENCAMLEKSLDRFNDYQSRVSLLEQQVFESKEIIHDKEEKAVDLQKKCQNLNKKTNNLNTELAKEKEEVERLRSLVETGNLMAQKAEEKLKIEIEKNSELIKDLKKMKKEKSNLERNMQSSVDSAAEMKIHLQNKHHMANVLEDKIKTLNVHLKEKSQEIELMKHEQEHKEGLHKCEISQLNAHMSQAQQYSVEREGVLGVLQEEQREHRAQLG